MHIFEEQEDPMCFQNTKADYVDEGTSKESMDCEKIRQPRKSRDIIFCSVLQHQISCMYARQIFPMRIFRVRNWTEFYSSNRLSQ
eukprot:1578244-Karenia_brevis.AAC.1